MIYHDDEIEKQSVNKTDVEINHVVNDRYVSDTRDRKWLSRWVAFVVSTWLLLIYFLLVENEAKIHLSDSVLIALVTTTTINILGLPVVVLLNLFPKTRK